MQFSLTEFEDLMFNDEPVEIYDVDDWMHAEADDVAESFERDPSIIRALLSELLEVGKPHLLEEFYKEVKTITDDGRVEKSWFWYVKAHLAEKGIPKDLYLDAFMENCSFA